jgi:hypothetical protein
LLAGKIMNNAHDIRDEPGSERSAREEGRFYVVAPSVSAVRRALYRAPGGARVVGRHDRTTVLCTHTMDSHSLARHWPVILSRLARAGLKIASSPEPNRGA